MPSQTQVTLYEVGLRFMQALQAYPSPNPNDFNATLSDAFRKQTIYRLRSALDRLRQSTGTPAVIGRRSRQIVRDVYTALHPRNTVPYGEVHTHLGSLRSALCDWPTGDEASRDDERQRAPTGPRAWPRWAAGAAATSRSTRHQSVRPPAGHRAARATPMAADLLPGVGPRLAWTTGYLPWKPGQHRPTATGHRAAAGRGPVLRPGQHRH